MTFIIRQVTRRATGQEIVRDKRVENTSLTVGRATGNDIFLSDLRVGLEHLEVTVAGNGLSVKAIGEKSFLLDNRSVQTATVKDRRGGSVHVGPYDLGFSVNDDGIWVVSVERTEPEEVLSEADVDAIFTLRGTSLRKRGPAWAFFITAAIVFLAMPVAWFMGAFGDFAITSNGVSFEQRNEDVTVEDAERGVSRTEAATTFFSVDFDSSWLSGPMSGGHANLTGECEACHKNAFEHVTDTTCLECHEDVADHADADAARLTEAMGMPGGFDGLMTQTAAVFGKEQGECASCHLEHNGDEGIVLEESSLCTDCHVGMADRLADTYVRDAGEFDDAHPNFQAVVVASPGMPAMGDTPAVEPIFTRVNLEDPELADNSGLKFNHAVHMVEDGLVQQFVDERQDLYGDALVCEDCHEAETGGLLFADVTMEDHCADCHSLEFGVNGEMVSEVLPHGEPEQVINIVSLYYRDFASRGASAVRNPPRRMRPGETTIRRAENQTAALQGNPDALAEQAIEELFTQGVCFQCHEVIPPSDDGRDYRVIPVELVDSFMTRSIYDHSSHEIQNLPNGEPMTCDSCHEARASVVATDVLLPWIDTYTGTISGEDVVGCRECHGGEDAGGDIIASPCLDCHVYHEISHGAQYTHGAGQEANAGLGQWRFGDAGATSSPTGTVFVSDSLR